MSLLHLATPEDETRLVPLVAAFQEERGIASDDTRRTAAVAPLLDGSPHGAVWLIGPRKAPVGYVAVSFGWSVDLGGLAATISQIFVRPAVRRRGLGGDALIAIAKALKPGGVRALHLELEDGDTAAQRFFARARFQPLDGVQRMSALL